MKTRTIDRRVSMARDGDQSPATGLAGYAAVFYDPADPGTEYKIGTRYRERIHKDAFTRALAERHDVRGVFNHNDSILLARSASGTLRLRVDDVGLFYEMDADNSDPDWRRVISKVARGDVTGSSFKFEILKESRTEDPDDELVVYELQDLQLYDVGPVTFPAYEAASAALRSDARFKDEFRLSLDEQQAVEVRLRLRELAMRFA